MGLASSLPMSRTSKCNSMAHLSGTRLYSTVFTHVPCVNSDSRRRMHSLFVVRCARRTSSHRRRRRRRNPSANTSGVCVDAEFKGGFCHRGAHKNSRAHTTQHCGDDVHNDCGIYICLCVCESPSKPRHIFKIIQHT